VTLANVVLSEERITMPSGLDPVKLQRAKELRRKMTPQERMLWLCLRANQLGGFDFYRQKVLAGLIVDFCCPEVHLVVEVDGSIHEKQVEYDAEHGAILQAQGWRVMRGVNNGVRHNTRAVLTRNLGGCHDSHPYMTTYPLLTTQTRSPSRCDGKGLGVGDSILTATKLAR
jgi:very-short-patch-repair endonuclease